MLVLSWYYPSNFSTIFNYFQKISVIKHYIFCIFPLKCAYDFPTRTPPLLGHLFVWLGLPTALPAPVASCAADIVVDVNNKIIINFDFTKKRRGNKYKIWTFQSRQTKYF